ncbi:serine/threonine-protein kinase [Candidatus Uabimicrobium amorphum]|uniref:Serine/threonine protein kinase n=1 Tax=Uabimicrobium amorphum TaxID=2596890 RepID=A0A5S9IIK7_UABAM|nr:serine/threonine-protein kinase [Candidatus Uabimicrobium amorphum]BBM82210.1 serine/threonine protein kinase [Candidatus Uabimicrobium amorphum]
MDPNFFDQSNDLDPSFLKGIGSQDTAPTKEFTMPSTSKFDRYMIEKELGRGGMGVVYKAYDTKLRRTVALKVILNSNIGDVKRFRLESEAMAQLHHPHIVRIYDFGEAPQLHFTMEYIDGVTLADLIDEQKIKPLFLINLMMKICDALASAHKHKILHRDIKPSNIMITRSGEPKLMDFGLAKIYDNAQQSLSKSNDIMGTLLYMAPEQMMGKATEKSDIYSIGATLYEALTYRNIYDGRYSHEILLQMATHRPTPPRQVNPQISPYLEAVCLKCLEKKQINRYKNCQQLVREFKNLKSNKPILAKKYTYQDTIKNFISEHRILVASTLAIIISLCVSLAVVVKYSFDIKREKIRAEQGENKARQATAAIKKEKERTKLALNKVMNILEYSVKNHSHVFRQDKNFAKLVSEVFGSVGKYGENEEWGAIKGFIAQMSGNLQQSLEYYNEQVANATSDPIVYYNRGRIFEELKKYKQAMADYDTALQLSPKYVDVYHAKATIYDIWQKYESALREYRKIMVINPDYMPAYFNSASTYEKLGNISQAFVNYNKALQLAPDHSQIYYQRGNLYSKCKNYKLALVDYSNAVRTGPDNAIYYYNRGSIYEILQDDKHAVLDYNKALQLNPNYVNAYFNRGNIHRKHKNHLQALRDYNKVVQYAPQDFEAYCNRGTIYFALQKYREAINDFHKSLAISPKYWQAHHNLYSCYKAVNENAKAQYHLQKSRLLRVK